MKTVPVAFEQNNKYYQELAPVYSTYNQWNYTFYLVKFHRHYSLIESTTGSLCSPPYATLHEAKEKALGDLTSHGRDKLKMAVNYWISDIGPVTKLPIKDDK